jgi:hypothetical protein
MTIKNFMNAAQALINQAVSEAQASDPDDFQSLAAMLRAGGLLRLAATFAPMTQQAMLQIVVIEPNGDEHQLMQCDLRPGAR